VIFTSEINSKILELRSQGKTLRKTTEKNHSKKTTAKITEQNQSVKIGAKKPPAILRQYINGNILLAISQR